MPWTFEELSLKAVGRSAPQDRAWKPAEWMEKFTALHGLTLTSYQRAAAAKLHNTSRLAIVGPHGLGKTAFVAWLVLSFVETFDGWLDWKVVTTASSWTQLTHYLWPEIRKWNYRRLRTVDRFEAQRHGSLQLGIKGRTGEAFPVASRNPVMAEGAHASAILFVFDEAKAIPDEMWDAAEGALTTKYSYAVATSTPGESRGRFYDIHRRKQGLTDWAVMRVTKDEAIAAKRMSAEWAEARRLQWGVTSAMYRRRVLGEFAQDEEHTVIPLDWVEAAQRRWEDRVEDWGELHCVGVDVGYGTAMSTIAKRHGLHISEIEVLMTRDTMAVADKVAELIGKAHARRGRYAVVDIVGYGAGVYDRLRQLGVRAWGFAAGGKSRASTADDPILALRFANLRSEAWWLVRELLNPENDQAVCLPNVEEVTADLVTPKWIAKEGRMIALESKDTLIKRLGRSTDWGDAIVQAYYPPPEFDEDAGEEDDYEIAVV